MSDMGKMTIEQAYKVMRAEWQSQNSVNNGDKLKILRPFRTEELGTPISFVSSMKNDVNKTLEVTDISITGGYRLNGWYWPFFCLELVEKAKPKLPAGVTFTADGLTVGEVYLSKDTIRRNLSL